MTHLAVSDADPDYFLRRHLKLTMSQDNVTVHWSIPARLLLKQEVAAVIFAEMSAELQEVVNVPHSSLGSVGSRVPARSQLGLAH